jgi:acetoin utilization protein AcuC
MSDNGRPRPGLLLWDPRYLAYDFGPEHPFQMNSRRLATDLLETIVGEAGWLRRDAEIPPAPRAELETFHRPEYIDRVEAISALGKQIPLDHGDTPSFPGCFEEAARVVEGSVRAVDFALRERGAAYHPAGGLHHAHPDAASGFCIFNDVAVGVARALADGRRVAYLDLDAHHGDGVMYGFYGSGRLLDIDVHQDGRTLFPGTGSVAETGAGDGAGLKVNVPVPPGAGDEVLTSLLPRLVPTLLRAFRPDLLVVQHGADGHAGDPLSGLRYTSVGFDAADRLLVALADELTDGRLVVTGGGGYRAAAVARVFARAGARTLGAAPPPLTAPLPDEWRADFARSLGTPSPSGWGDPIPPSGRPPWRDGEIDRLVAELGERLGLRFPPADTEPAPP